MNLINKNIFLFICFSVLSCNGSDYEKSNSEDKIIQEIRDEVKKKFDADEADEIINDLVQDALKKCCINRSIIVLERRGGSNSYAYSCSSRHPQEFIIVGTRGKTLDQITFSIYHEIGHLVHGDLLFQKHQFDCYCARGTIRLSSIGGLCIGLGFYKLVKNPIVGLTAGVAIGGLTTVLAIALGAGYKFYKNSLKELKADTFAYDNLVKHGKLNVVIMRISDFIYTHEFNNGIASLPAFVCGYPNDLQRAQNGLKVLQKLGIDIPTLIKNLPEDLDQGIKEHFPDQIQRFFTDFA